MSSYGFLIARMDCELRRKYEYKYNAENGIDVV